MSADEVGAYDAELVARLRAVLGDALVGVYVSGSAALGDYVPGKIGRAHV
jgi:predicted nucleotidyltransferase